MPKITPEEFTKFKEALEQMNKEKQTESKSACPNCGYCPHCGRSNGYYYQPYPYYWYGKLDSGTTTQSPDITWNSIACTTAGK